MKKIIGFVSVLFCAGFFISQEAGAFSLGSLKKKVEIPGAGSAGPSSSGGNNSGSYGFLKTVNKTDESLEDVQDKGQVWQSVKSHFSSSECVEEKSSSRVADGPSHHYVLHCGRAFPSEKKCIVLNAKCHQEPSRNDCSVDAGEDIIRSASDPCPSPIN